MGLQVRGLSSDLKGAKHTWPTLRTLRAITIIEWYLPPCACAKRSDRQEKGEAGFARTRGVVGEGVQGYLAYKKTHPPRTLPQAYA